MTYSGDGSAVGGFAPVPPGQGRQPATPNVRPNGWWYATVVVLWIASVVFAVTAVRQVADLVDAGVTHNGSPFFAVPSGGLTIYTSPKPVERLCHITSAGGAQQTMDAFSFDFTTSSGGRTWWAVASTPKGLSPGNYTIFCQGIRNTDLWYGKRIDLQSLFIRLGLAGVCGLLGLVALVVLLITRHTSKSRIRRAMIPSYGGPVPGWVAPGYGGPVPAPPANPYDPNAPAGWGPPPPGPAQAPTTGPVQGFPTPPAPPGWGQPPPTPGWGQPAPPTDEQEPPR